MEAERLHDGETLGAQGDDPRVERTNLHRVRDRIILVMCGGICGAEGGVEMEECAKAKEAFVPQLLLLPNGIPSHETFGRVVARIDPHPLDARVVQWVAGIRHNVSGVVASDGKTLRPSHDQAAGKTALHLVSAWAVEKRLVLAQVATAEQSNAMTAIPLLLPQGALSGWIVTIDAMGTHTKIAAQMVEQGGDSALSLKDTQGNREEEVPATVTMAENDGFRDRRWESDRRVENGHRRLEIRASWTIRDQTSSRIWIGSTRGSDCQAWAWSEPNDAWGRTSVEQHARSCSPSRRGAPWPTPFEGLGGWNRACIGSLMWRFEQTIHASVKTTLTRSWPCDATSP